MSKYGMGIDFIDSCNMEREEIVQALAGRVRVGEDENGFIYDEGTPKDCRNVILGNYDGIVYQAMEMMACAVALGELLEKKELFLDKEKRNLLTQAWEELFEDDWRKYDGNCDDVNKSFGGEEV